MRHSFVQANLAGAGGVPPPISGRPRVTKMLLHHNSATNPKAIATFFGYKYVTFAASAGGFGQTTTAAKVTSATQYKSAPSKCRICIHTGASNSTSASTKCELKA